ncbi:DUF262 domain-containing protein [Sorangium sp. So ce269]
MARMFDTPVLPRLADLLEEVREGTIQVPDFQRGYVWTDDQRLRLMDSIWQGIPIGSLLVWRTTADRGIRVKTRIGPCELLKTGEANVKNYLVDGLQRVTTLYAALMPLPEGVERDAEGRRWPIYFELDPKPEDDLRFQLRRGDQEVSPTSIPLSCLLDDELFFKARAELVRTGRKDLLPEARRLESRFRDYVVPVLPLVSDDQNLVTEAFARVNSLGQDLDEGDMAHALTLQRNFSFNDELATVTEQLSPMGWGGLDRRTLIAAFKAIWGLDMYKSGAKGIQSKLGSQQDRDVLRVLPEVFENVAGLLRAFGVYGPGSLPYAYQLVALVRAVHRIRGDSFESSVEPLRRWFFWTTYDEHFTGMTSGQLRMEFDRVEDLIRGKRRLDWVVKPCVVPLQKLRPNAVRSRAAVLVMAIAGDHQAGGARQQQLYGAQGTNALHRLFTDQPAEDLANRLLSTDDELRRLRAWAHGPSSGQLPLFAPPEEALLRRNLLDPLASNAVRDPTALLQSRAARLQQEERNFVKDLGALWESEAPETP